MNQTTKIVLILAILIAAGAMLVLGSLLIAGWFLVPTRSTGISFQEGFAIQTNDYASNGERIYFTGASESGPPIRAQMEGMRRMPGGRSGCASCHGADARGARVSMMMSTVTAPDIRWEHLTEEEHDGEHGEDHPAYTAETFKRAVTEGLNPSGEELHWIMPRWEMSDSQIDDLISYLQSIE
ncbi:MAG: cytochrome c [Anaerolineales bacterium]|nr:cytochrome c [Anaerolineales bacterium]